ncbi:NRAMP family divalent metal transporter [Phocicoccus pinnipedialis]|uniref:Manganese transport protein MntH n=1 Tax=Phocicoccus pinnipedialis TaxID=110845 RepID=A0A6V7R9R1_9BACL|nr:divalent metal cation transporter [Jeotgalicoccus pinnipedialis]MBP1940180.1 Mn2+/Fe2+ NRAMP family transporter [Jeotgalicoccus pinnipedialis]CAD2073883.1 manganese transport protein MntH [Jeotgalicoccus pinnipedialis]
MFKEFNLLDSKQKRKLIGAIFIMMTASITPAFLITTADLTNELKTTFAFVILVTLIIELGFQMNLWRVVSVSGKPIHYLINTIVPRLGQVISFLVILGGLAFNIIAIIGMGVGFNLAFGLDVKLGATIGVLLAILIFIFKAGRDNLDLIAPILGVVIIFITAFTYFFVFNKVPYDEIFVRTIMPADLGSTIVPIAMVLAGTIGGYISLSGAHRLIDGKITGAKYRHVVTSASNLSVILTSLVRVFIFLIVIGLIASNTILFTDSVLENSFMEIYGSFGNLALGILYIIAAITSISATTYTAGTMIKSYNIALKKHLNIVLVMYILTAWLINLIVAEPTILVLFSFALNGILIPVILGGILHATRRKDIVGNYKHPLWMSAFGVVALIFTFISAFYMIYELRVLF